MSDKKEGTKGGFHFGNVKGNVSQKASGDIVGGDKKITTTTTTTVQSGFGNETQKKEFEQQLELLREALRQLKAQVETSADLSADEKDELAGEILQRVQALKEVKETTAPLAPGQKPSAEVSKRVEDGLEKTSGILDKLKTVAKKSAELAANVGEVAAKYGPIVLSARHLFGLP
jgi:hypothetical protein